MTDERGGSFQYTLGTHDNNRVVSLVMMCCCCCSRNMCLSVEGGVCSGCCCCCCCCVWRVREGDKAASTTDVLGRDEKEGGLLVVTEGGACGARTNADHRPRGQYVYDRQRPKQIDVYRNTRPMREGQRELRPAMRLVRSLGCALEKRERTDKL